tara:strand:+ start:174 stop:443 length:270 start_codon:yes stop_codon:yes gene_type:complete
MKVENMTSSKGNKVANQFVITTPSAVYFQSYETIIAKKDYFSGIRVYLDRDKWDYSSTTSKYRNQFLGETTKETQAKIESGEYILTNLN